MVRRKDGVAAYQLAVVVDDAAMEITHVVRGADLLPSTARQLLLYRALGLEPPAFLHVPLLLGPDGERLAKRHGAVSLRELREAGVPPEPVVGLARGHLRAGRARRGAPGPRAGAALGRRPDLPRAHARGGARLGVRASGPGQMPGPARSHPAAARGTRPKRRSRCANSSTAAASRAGP